jgi:hypothetical protein
VKIAHTLAATHSAHSRFLMRLYRTGYKLAIDTCIYTHTSLHLRKKLISIFSSSHYYIVLTSDPHNNIINNIIYEARCIHVYIIHIILYSIIGTYDMLIYRYIYVCVCVCVCCKKYNIFRLFAPDPMQRRRRRQPIIAGNNTCT